MAKKHQRQTPAKQGGIIDKDMPMPPSSVPSSARPTARPGSAYEIEDDGKKVRFCRKCGGRPVMATARPPRPASGPG